MNVFKYTKNAIDTDSDIVASPLMGQAFVELRDIVLEGCLLVPREGFDPKYMDDIRGAVRFVDEILNNRTQHTLQAIELREALMTCLVVGLMLTEGNIEVVPPMKTDKMRAIIAATRKTTIH